MDNNIPIKNIYYILLYAWKKLKEAKHVDISMLDDNTELINLLAKILLDSLNYLIKRKPDRNYIIFTEQLKTVRGKINFSESVKRNLLKKCYLLCDYDDLSFNILHNQIIKSTIFKILNYGNNLDPSFRRPLKNIYIFFKDVDLITLNDRVFKEVKLNRNNQFYRLPLNVCELIFNNPILNPEKGKYRFYEILEDNFNIIFEEFVRNFYALELKSIQGFEKVNVIGSEIIKWNIDELQSTDISKLPDMKTDISIVNNNIKLIIDTKFYKENLTYNFDNEKFISPNLYQIFSYLKNSKFEGQVNGLLLYAQTNKNGFDEIYKIQGHRIRIKTLNLNQEWRFIKNDLLTIAQDELL